MSSSSFRQPSSSLLSSLHLKLLWTPPLLSLSVHVYMLQVPLSAEEQQQQ